MTPFAADETINSGWTVHLYDLVVGVNRWSYGPAPRESLTDFAPLCPLTVWLPLWRRRHPAAVAIPTSPGQQPFRDGLTGM
jgi:hypothetical protein